MKKLRSDSKWQRLTLEQRQQVLNWLFEGGLSLAEALERARKEFGVEASITSLRRFYHHAAEERRIGALMGTVDSVQVYRAAATKVLGITALETAMRDDHQDDMKKLARVMRLVLKEREIELRERGQGLEGRKLAFAMALEGLKLKGLPKAS